MAYKLEIQDTAKSDILEAIDYYEFKQSGLGKRFLNAFKKKSRDIRLNPEGYAIKYKNVRMAVINKFPYVIHFQMDNSKKIISILSVFYGGINPNKWLNK